MDSGGPRDSVRTGRTGAFRLAVTAPDTTALYMVSTTYRGLTYFSQVRTARDSGGPLEPLVVYDTSSTGPAISVAQRHIVIRDAEGSGRRSVLELVALANDGDRTRIAGEPPQPTWIGRIPADAANFTVGQGDVSSEAVRLAGDSVVVTAPIPPGVKQLILTYDVPGGREVRLPIDQPADRLLVLLSDTGAVVTDGPLMRQGTEVFDDTQFAVFSGTAQAGGDAMVFSFTRRRVPTATATAVMPGRGLLLLLAIPLLARRSPEAVRARAPEHRGARAAMRLDPSTSGSAQSRGNRDVPGAARGPEGPARRLACAAARRNVDSRPTTCAVPRGWDHGSRWKPGAAPPL
jgi:hypothetical protein